MLCLGFLMMRFLVFRILCPRGIARLSAVPRRFASALGSHSAAGHGSRAARAAEAHRAREAMQVDCCGMVSHRTCLHSVVLRLGFRACIFWFRAWDFDEGLEDES